MILFAIGSALLMLTCAIWYFLSLRNNRKKAVRIIRWIEASLAGKGCILGIRWLASSRFKVPLRLTCGTFQKAWILVELAPCESPITWLASHMKKRQDLLVFEAPTRTFEYLHLELPAAAFAETATVKLHIPATMLGVGGSGRPRNMSN